MEEMFNKDTSGDDKKQDIAGTARDVKKLAARFKAFADDLAGLAKRVEKGGYNPFVAAADLHKVMRKAPKGDELADAVARANGLLEQFAEIIEQQQSRQRLAIVNELAQGMAEIGLGVTGQIPMLKAGPFTLVFDFGEKASVKVFLGPKIYALGKVPMDVDKVVTLVKQKYQAFFVDDFDVQGFVRDLLAAYNAILKQDKLEPGSRVKISQVMLKYVLMKQRKAFFVDPRRENFASVGRMEFACMLYRASSMRRVDAWEMRMDVAAMGDTKDPLDHLWVPGGMNGQGVNYTTMRFVRRGNE